MNTFTLNNGTKVLARIKDGKPWPLQYLGRPQAEKKALQVGGTVFRSAAGRVFYVVINNEVTQ
jgi:hypothetical protein